MPSLQALTKQPKRELTPEEKRQREKEFELQDIERELPYIPKPTYSFQVGDHVKYGGFKDAVIDEIFHNGFAYGLNCISEKHNYNGIIEEECYRVASWVRLRPLVHKQTSFTKEDNIRLSYNNSTIESLLHYQYHFGVDMEPEYQRDYVWTKEDKEDLIDSIFNNIDIGKVILNHLDNSDWRERGVSYEIVDGKQRLSTLLEYYENRFPYKGMYFNDLSPRDKYTFLEHPIAIAEVRNLSKEDVLTLFLRVNKTGRVMSKDHLVRVEEQLKTLQEEENPVFSR